MVSEIPTDPNGPPDQLPGAIDVPNEIDFEVTYDYLNVRSGPSTHYPQIDRLSKGDIVHGKIMYSQKIWIEYEKGKWCAVTHGGNEYMKFIVKTGIKDGLQRIFKSIKSKLVN